VDWVGKTADNQTQTCNLRMKGNALVDRSVVQKALDDQHVGATVRGIEAVMEGQLIAPDSAPSDSTAPDLRLKLRSSKLVVQLAPLIPEHVVQWDRARKQPMASTPSELDAYRRLGSGSGHANVGDIVQVVGPVREAERGATDLLPVLEVRDWKRGETDP
jgi:hypothetical protein